MGSKSNFLPHSLHCKPLQYGFMVVSFRSEFGVDLVCSLRVLAGSNPTG